MYSVKMKVRTVMDQEHQPGKRQVNLYPAEQTNAPGDMQMWIPEADMTGIKAGAVVTVTINPE